MRSAAVAGAHLVPGQVEYPGRRADEHEARLPAGQGEGRALGEQTVAGVDRIGPDPPRGTHERLGVEE